MKERSGAAGTKVANFTVTFDIESEAESWDYAEDGSEKM
jgi:hypothetical protein